MPNLTPEQIAEGRARDKSATPAPWGQGSEDGTDDFGVDWENPTGDVLDSNGDFLCEFEECEPEPEVPVFPDAALVAWLRNNASALLDAAERLQKAERERDEARQRIAELERALADGVSVIEHTQLGLDCQAARRERDEALRHIAELERELGWPGKAAT